MYFNDPLHRNTGVYKELQEVTGAYKGLKGVTGVTKKYRNFILIKTFPDTFLSRTSANTICRSIFDKQKR